MVEVDAPRRRLCGTMEVHYRLLERSTTYRRNRLRLGVTAGDFLRRATQVNLPVHIAVAVHVVYRNSDENVDDRQVATQIEVLNQDYTGGNSDFGQVPGVWQPIAMNQPLVQFSLQAITRTETARTGFGTDDSVKSSQSGGADFTAGSLLNLWVCTLQDDVLGYAQFPGGPVETDGVVISSRAFGTTGTASAPFGLGRTTTHEVGHWLDLRHIWGDRLACRGNDEVADTPPQEGPNYGSPTFPHVTCNNGPDGDMFMNYMDYVDDRSMYMFTMGQQARMVAALLARGLVVP